MATVAIEGMKFYAYHGFYEEEQLLGNYFIIDAYITAETRKAAVNDDLYQTINYETIYLICQREMRHKSRLLENVVERISLGIKHQFPFIKEMKIKMRKLNPPLGGQVADSYVETEGNFTKKCGRCSRPMLCYGDKSCWCLSARVHQATLDGMKIQFGNQCLCQECLSFFAD